jgi:hypothetical protein
VHSALIGNLQLSILIFFYSQQEWVQDKVLQSSDALVTAYRISRFFIYCILYSHSL